MPTEIGEYVVGAYLKMEEGCDFVDFNVRPPGGGLKGLGEMDVIGLNFKTETVFLCEVSTHVIGLNYGSYSKTVERVAAKHQRQREYAREFFRKFHQAPFHVLVAGRTEGLLDREPREDHRAGAGDKRFLQGTHRTSASPRTDGGAGYRKSIFSRTTDS